MCSVVVMCEAVIRMTEDGRKKSIVWGWDWEARVGYMKGSYVKETVVRMGEGGT